MHPHNILYAQSGGVTAVLNATACGVIERARTLTDHFSSVYCAQNGILGVLREELIDTSFESAESIAALKYTPAGAFGSCRYKLKSFDENRTEYEHLARVLKAHNIGTFLYNGGGDSQDTTNKLSQIMQGLGVNLRCIGIPKTIDNDLMITDNCPGFGSVAKYIAISIQEASLDVASMAASSTKVFVMEVMGRHTGWIAAAGGLASHTPAQGPHIILFPEIPFQEQAFLQRVETCVKQYGFCAIVVSEGIKDNQGRFLTDVQTKDAFGHSQLGGVAPYIAKLIHSKCGYKYHWAVLDYLQRAARHIASAVDVEQAYQLGARAVELAAEGKTAIMPVIVRDSDEPYRYHIGEAPLVEVANIEKPLPSDYITADGFHITQKARAYLLPLIQGEAYPPYRNGLPEVAHLERRLVKRLVSGATAYQT